MKKNRKTIAALLAALLLASVATTGLASCSDNVTYSDLMVDDYDDYYDDDYSYYSE